jgi:hypothetical protein
LQAVLAAAFFAASVAVVVDDAAEVAGSAVDAAVLLAAFSSHYSVWLLSDLPSPAAVITFDVPSVAAHTVCPAAAGTFYPASGRPYLEPQVSLLAEDRERVPLQADWRYSLGHSRFALDFPDADSPDAGSTHLVDFRPGLQADYKCHRPL